MLTHEALFELAHRGLRDFCRARAFRASRQYDPDWLVERRAELIFMFLNGAWNSPSGMVH